MRKLSFIFILLFIMIESVSSQDPKVFFNEGIVFIKNFNLEINDTIIDGNTIHYPKNWNLRKGSDNRIVIYPDGWTLNEGKDGHMIAFPKGWIAIEGKDGRLVPFLYKEKIVSFKKKKEDCIVSESDDCMINVMKSVNEYGLYYKVGKDGRAIIYTGDMNIASSPDGRLVNLPKGWEISQSAKGRFNAYPKNWDAFVLEDDKEVAMPRNWVIDIHTNSPKIVSSNNFMKFIFTPVQKIKIAEALYNADKVNGLDYVLYMLFNQE